MNTKTLLFYFSDEKCSASSAVVPTLAHLAESIGVDFESYICTRPKSWNGKVLPFTGHNHAQSFYYLANFYDKIVFCSLSSFPGSQFKREIIAFGGDVVSCKKPEELAEFYKDIYSYFKVSIPESATIIPEVPKAEGQSLWLAPYCYPEVYFSSTLGVSADVIKDNPKFFVELGVKQAKCIYCDVNAKGVLIETIDTVKPDDTYGTITSRIAERWVDKASGISHGSPSCILRWNAYFCREKLIPLYQPTEWKKFVPVIKKYADKINNYSIVGSQTVVPMSDDVITEFAKYDLIFSLIGVDPRVGFTIQAKHPLPIDWLEDAPTPWEMECSDEFLLEKIERRATPVCFMLYAADLGHLPVLPRVLDLMSMDGMRAGLAFPSTWYEYHPELLEQIYIPLEQGGVFPQLEPIISSVGVAVAPEAEGLMEPKMLTSLLKKSKAEIASYVGERMVPKGYYPFQDACPYYKHGTGKPQFDAVAQAGFDYYITYQDEGERAKIISDTNKMMVLNQQIIHWFPGWTGQEESPLQCIERLGGESFMRRERWLNDSTVDASDWIVLAFDMPFFGITPAYMGTKKSKKWTVGMQALCESMQYALNGGRHGELFLLKPHELFRYAKLLRKLGLK